MRDAGEELVGIHLLCHVRIHTGAEASLAVPLEPIHAGHLDVERDASAARPVRRQPPAGRSPLGGHLDGLQGIWLWIAVAPASLGPPAFAGVIQR